MRNEEWWTGKGLWVLQNEERWEEEKEEKKRWFEGFWSLSPGLDLVLLTVLGTNIIIRAGINSKVNRVPFRGQSLCKTPKDRGSAVEVIGLWAG